MSKFYRCLFCVVMLLGSAPIVFSQEDLPRELGLPTRIGGSRCDGARPGAVATIQGVFNVSGLQNSEKQPKFTIALYAAGVYMSRQRVKNGGSFYFYCVPDQSATLVAEIDSTEVGSYSLPHLAPPPQTNYQDIYVSWAGEASRLRNEVISIRNSYSRSAENQKAFDKAMARLREKNGDVTRKMLEELLEKDPKDFVAWTEVGSIHFNQGRFNEAVSSYERAFTLKPDFETALYGGGRAHLGLKQLDKSIELLSRALSLKPDSADINHYLGEAHLQNRKGSLAITHMRRAMELSPDDKADLHLKIGWLYDAAGAKNLAAEEYRQLLKKKPDHPSKEKLLKYITENSE